MASQERLVVVVVTYNSERYLEGFFESLKRGLCGTSARIIVADNASSDGSVATVRRLNPDAEVVELGRNAGYAAGINAAVASAGEFDAVLVLNPDVRLRSGCARGLLNALGKPGIGIAVPCLTDAEGELIWSMRREPTVLRSLTDALIGAERAGHFQRFGEVNTKRDDYLCEMETDWAEGSTQMISADCWNACGPWDESYFLYSEETEFDLRARDLGYATLYVSTASAVHLEGDSAGSPVLWALVATNRVRLFKRRNGWPKAVLFWSATTLREALRVIVGRKTNRAALRALVDPRNLFRKPGPDLVRRIGPGR